MRPCARFAACLILPWALACRLAADPAALPRAVPPNEGESHLADLRMLTDGGENAEAYWSPDGRRLTFQSSHPPYACDQIFLLDVDSAHQTLASTGKGRTTCSYFLKGGERILYASTHAASPDCPPPPDRSHGYVWPIYGSYDIWTARPDGSDLERLTTNEAYDAEATVCPVDGSIVFTSTRDGDLDLYRMDADGGNVRRLTSTPGYDGGAFFSADCQKLVWRASHPKPGPELEEYQSLLKQGLVRPGSLEIWTADADGTNARQVTYLGAASFAPYFFPAGDRIIFSSNYGDPKGREFELWAVNTDGTGLERITRSPGFDGFPIFSPDGKTLAFASNRGDAKPGETNLFVASWAEGAKASGAPETAAAERFAADIRYLADDAREGRGAGTRGLAESARFLAERLAALGLAPAYGNGDFLQPFDVPVSVRVEPGTAVTADGRELGPKEFVPAGFSASASVTAPVVAAGYGIVASEVGVDDFAQVDVKGKIALVRRFAPDTEPFKDADKARRLGALRAKAFNARERGAVGVIVVDLPDKPPAAGEPPADAPLPPPVAVGGDAALGDAGLPVVLLSREAGKALFAPGEHRATLSVALKLETARVANVAGVIRAGAPDKLPGAVVIGAHYDHLGLGGQGSLAPGERVVHNGADDNASGTAALLEIARQLATDRGKLKRDVYITAFAGEELGLLGSAAYVRHLPDGLKAADLVAMLNLDMVGRMSGNLLQVLGSDSAAEWGALVEPVCAKAAVACQLGGGGFGRSDQSSFYAAGVPVLHFFTGVHSDYHKPSDDVDKINAIGGARTAAIVADVAEAVADRPERLTLKQEAAPPPGESGDSRSYGASLGTVPDFAGDGKPGVLISAVRPGSPAEKAGIQRGDRLVELGGRNIRDLYDMTYVLRQAKPGQRAKAVIERDGKRIELDVVFAAGGQR